MRVLLLLFLVVGSAAAAPDEEYLGKAEGYPVCPSSGGFSPQRCLVGNYSNFDKLVTARKIAKGAQVRPFKRLPKEADGVRFDDYLAHNRNTGLILLKGDTVLLERYQYDRNQEHRFTSMSMAKTVVGMLVGIAIDEGKIQSIDDRADRYLPELKDTGYGETTIRHLLTMSSGMRFREDYDGGDDVSILGRMTFSGEGPGGIATVLPFKQRQRDAGTRFSYASGDSQVLGLVLRAAVGKPLAEYLSEKIWQPMGAEADASWLVDAGGYEFGYAGIQAALRDFARFGLLLANDGAVDGKQLIPAAWVRAATVPESRHLQIGAVNAWTGYGYQTWILSTKPRQFALLGVRGQAIFVDSDSKLVLVHTAVHASPRDTRARSSQFSLWSAVLRTYAN